MNFRRLLGSLWRHAPGAYLCGECQRMLPGSTWRPTTEASGKRALSWSTSQTKLRVAVVGSGPAGFYTADRLCRRSANVAIDLLEELPTPFGLVRSGVAPDHPDTKNVENRFTSVAENPSVRFLGNVCVGKSVSVDELLDMYHAVVLAYGAGSDRQLQIPGEDALGCLSSREFVNWYNAHPYYASVPVDLTKVSSVAIIGLGNVALDCARILLKPAAALEDTDIAEHAMHVLRGSAVRDVHIVGRRGPMQAQFSGKELREVLSMENISIAMHPENYTPTDADLKAPRKNQKVEL
jgi:adrenodoxin-NADP+ reductase